MSDTIVGLLLIAFGVFLCIRRRWVADKLQPFYSSYPLIRLAGPEQQRARGSFVVILGLVFAGIGIAILRRWLH